MFRNFVCSTSKRRKTEKVGKGLRHFSMKVCEKVRKKGTTSYNEVADELVGEFSFPNLSNSPAEQVSIFIFSYIGTYGIQYKITLFVAVRSKKYPKKSVRCSERTNGHEYNIKRKERN